jgi:cell division protein ZipA
MNELRWILLVAGALLIVGIYVWGVRVRGRGSPGLESRRAAGFGAGDSTPAGERESASAEHGFTVEPGTSAEVRRLEPSVSLDEDIETVPAIERREPTYAARAESAATPRVDVPGQRAEPTLAPRAEVAFETRRPEPSLEPPAPAEETPKPRRPQKIFAMRVSPSGATRMRGDVLLDALQSEGLRFGRYQIFHRLHDDGRPIFSVASLKDPGTFDPPAMAGTEYPGILVFAVLPGPVGAAEAFDEMLFTARALATHLGGALADEKGVPLTAHRAGRIREDALEFERAVAGAA